MPNKYPPLEDLKKSGEILKKAFLIAEKIIKPGISTAEINKSIHKFIVSSGAAATFLGYRGFPSACCTSVNEEVVHGIPSSRRLQEGDILSLDCGVTYNRAITDACRTYGVGTISSEARLLIDITREALRTAIQQAVVGNRVGDISYAIQKTAERPGFNVARQFGGHGVGYQLHMLPLIPNYGERGIGELLVSGMVLAIEPVVFRGSFKTKEMDDWKVVSLHSNLSAHFENTVFISREGPIVLTE